MSHDSYSRTGQYDDYMPSDVDKVRHLIGDVYEEFTFLSEPEIQFAIDDNNGNLKRAAAACCHAIAARVARNTDYRFSTLWQTSSQAYKHFKDLAKDLEQMASSSVTLSGIEAGFSDTEEEEAGVFKVGIFDAPGTDQEHGAEDDD